MAVACAKPLGLRGSLVPCGMLVVVAMVMIMVMTMLVLMLVLVAILMVVAMAMLGGRHVGLSFHWNRLAAGE